MSQISDNSDPAEGQNVQPPTKRQRKSKFKGKQWESLPWTKVNVSATQPLHDEDDGNKKNKGGPSKNKKKSEDVQSKNTGFFYGLEVIPADSYRIEKTADGITTKIMTVESTKEEEPAAVTIKKKVEKAPSENEKVTSKKETVTSTKEMVTSKKEKVISKENKATNKDEIVTNSEEAPDTKEEDEPTKNAGKKKKKRKKKRKKKDPSIEHEHIHPTEPTPVLPPADTTISLSWTQNCSGLSLHPVLLSNLTTMNYPSPTPIQALTLPPAIYGRRNIIGAAPTGSGKTLAFALPMFHTLLTEPTPGICGLIITPTRELAMQIAQECSMISKGGTVKVGSIVGGLSEEKQRRVIGQLSRHEGGGVLVCTVGRLWKLISSGEHACLNSLSLTVRFLVMDEVDRMLTDSKKCFPELKLILECLQKLATKKSQEEEEKEVQSMMREAEEDFKRTMEEQEERKEQKEEVRRMQRNAKKGITDEIEPDEVDVVMMDDILNKETPEEDSDGSSHSEENDVPEESPNEDTPQSDKDAELQSKLSKRQTFIFSATLLLSKTPLNQKQLTAKQKKQNLKKADQYLVDLMDRAGATGPTKVLDLTTPFDQKTTDSTQEDAATSSMSSRLPPGLTLQQLKCTQHHKDAFCYAIIATVMKPGPCLIFCNSIRGAKRVASTLGLLLGGRERIGCLYGDMIQKSRIKTVESLKKANSNTVVVATDVAARGLDIPSVTTVIHYDVARTMDTFVHRAGRTARGVGEKAVGTSITLVAPGDEEKRQVPIVKLFPFQDTKVDGRIVTESQRRAGLATKIVKFNDGENEVRKDNQWFLKAAKETDIDLEDDDLQEEGGGSGVREKALAAEVKQAKVQLKQLLTTPMRKQKFGKFLFAGRAEVMKDEEGGGKYLQTIPKNKGKGKKRRR